MNATGPAVGAVVGAVATPFALATGGFGAGGVVASSMASVWHSSIGNVVTPSLFASLQSAGAGGYATVAVKTTAGAIGGAVGMAGRYFHG